MNELKQLNVATKNYNGQFEIVDEKARLAVLELNDEVTKLVTDTTELNEKLVQETGKLSEEIVDLTFGNVGYTTPETFGAIGDGITDDTDALQNAIDYCIENLVELKSKTNKTYLTTKKIFINGVINIDFGMATIKGNHEDHMFEIYCDETDRYGVISNLNIDCNSISYSGLWCRQSKRWMYENIIIKNTVGIALYANSCHDTRFKNLYIADTADRGIYVDGTDMTFTDVNIIGFKTAIVNNNDGNIFTRIHAWNLKNFADTIFAKTKGSAIFRDCAPDTVALCYDIEGAAKTIIDGGIFICNSIWDNEMNDRWTLFKWTNNDASRYTKISHTYLSNGSSKVPFFSAIESRYIRCEFESNNIFNAIPIGLPIGMSMALTLEDATITAENNTLRKKDNRVAYWFDWIQSFTNGENLIGNISVSYFRPFISIKRPVMIVTDNNIKNGYLKIDTDGNVYVYVFEDCDGELIADGVFDTDSSI